MEKGHFSDEQIVAVLRDAEATTAVAAARKHGVLEPSIYRWRNKYAGMEVSDVRELKRLRDENTRLKKLLAERDLEVAVMKEIQAKKWCAPAQGAPWHCLLLNGVLPKGEQAGFVRHRDRGFTIVQNENAVTGICRPRCA